MDLILPYKVGDLAESKSLVSGYRGAWFRCKVKAHLPPLTSLFSYYVIIKRFLHLFLICGAVGGSELLI